MRLKDNKFYITQQELEELHKIEKMFDSPDLEQVLLARSLLATITPREFYIYYDQRLHQLNSVLIKENPGHASWINKRYWVIE